MTNASASKSGGDRVLYGCMGLGGSWDPDPYGPADIDAAEAAVGAALDSGITTFDHADIYRHGKAEAVFGEVLARTPGLRERITLQTKCGIRLGDKERPGIYDLRGESITRRVEESLGRLRTDVIDVLLLHRPDPLADVDSIAAALTSLHRQGLVRAFGVSNMGAAQIAHLQARLDVPLVANQLEMSLHSRDWVEAGVLLNTPPSARNGFLSGRWSTAVTTASASRPGARSRRAASPAASRRPPNWPPPSCWPIWPGRRTPPPSRSCCGG